MMTPRTALLTLSLLALLGCGAPTTGQGDAQAAGESSSTQDEEHGTTGTTAPTEALSGTATGAAAGTTRDPEATGETSDDPGSTAETTGDPPSTGDATTSTESGEADTSETTIDTDDATGDLCLPACAISPEDPFVDCVIGFDPAPATVEAGGYNHDALPEVVLGPPGGSADVVALGCGGEIVLGFAEPFIGDGPGPDFIVFENPFNVSFPEPGRVEVSADGCTWSTFPCDPVALTGCAGKSVTKAVPGSGLDPTDPAVAGGDAFDLADVGLDLARYLRIVDVSEAHWSEMGKSFCDPGQAGKGGFDLNAVAVVHGSE